MKTIKIAAFIILYLLLGSCQELADDLVGKKPPDAKTITITMVAKSSTNPVFLSALVGAEAAAKDLSEKHSMIDVKINWRTPKYDDPNQQAQRIRNAVNDGTEAIIVTCSDTDTLTKAINEAVEKGVPVMTFDSDAPDSRRFAFYGPDDEAIGENVMNELLALMGNEGQVAILGGNKSAPNLQKRVKGIQKVAAAHPGIEIVGEFYHVETAEQAAAEVIRINAAYPNLKGWAMVGGWPFFNDWLLDKLEPGKLKIIAVDALPAQLPYIEKGIVSVLFGQPTFKWGKVSVEKIIDKVYLEEDVPKLNPMKLIRVSIENLGGWSRQLNAWGYEGVPIEYMTM